ncbi:MAG: prepilin-type N-terminal cleavage/methylation domain-containing protein [Planctomycetes bacterium]|nr:prepilin-type N-terminal cleavage/methylation domain-containing protein [Planctomycetota bacterium]
MDSPLSRRGDSTPRSAFTLIEILVALVILLIGITGVMSLLVLGIRQTKETSEEFNASMLAQSVAAALQVAMSAPRAQANPVANNQGPILWVNFIHDGVGTGTSSMVALPNTTMPQYPFPLPYESGDKRHHPGGRLYPQLPNTIEAAPTPSPASTSNFNTFTFGVTPVGAWVPATVAGVNPLGNEIFRIGGTPQVGLSPNPLVRLVRDVNGSVAPTPPDVPNVLLATDVTVDSMQYFYDFIVERVPNPNPNLNRPNVNPPVLVNRWEFRVRIFRNYDLLTAGQWNDPNQPPVHVYTFQATVGQ